jgi:hypothetical protein
MMRRGGAARLAPFVTALVACTSAPEPLRLPTCRVAVSGSELLAQLGDLPLAAREARIAEHFDQGNVPTLLGRLAPVQLRATIGERTHTATVWCTPDYFGLGTDADWLRLPITPQLAQRLADRLDCVLPTRKLVDTIWTQAITKVEPQPFHPRDHDILSLRVFAEHHRVIEAQCVAAGHTTGTLLAGHMKDVVLSPQLATKPDRVAICGWHRLDGRAIQPLWTGHTTAHVDYSHGIRFVRRAMLLDGEPTNVDAVLADPVLHVLLSDEGPITAARYPTR